jgi:uncharacterized protein with gpF-like domain
MPIPKPNKNEPRGDYMGRCVRFLLNEGTPNEQAIAICYNTYRDENRKKIQQDYIEWKTIDSKRKALEPFAERVFTKALKIQLKQYLDEVERTGSIDFDLEGIVTDEPIDSAYTEVYERIIPMFAIDSFNQLQKTQKKAKTNWRAIARRWLRQSDTTDKIVRVSKTTRKRIRKQVVLGLKDGTSIPNFAKTVSNDYGFSKKRGRLIGRTEMVSASNAGSLLGAQESGVPFIKKWLSTMDDRTRGLKGGFFDHWSMSGRSADAQGFFNVSGELMQYPGDSSQASAGNTINCRCTLTYEPIIPEEIFDAGFDIGLGFGLSGMLDDSDI